MSKHRRKIVMGVMLECRVEFFVETEVDSPEDLAEADWDIKEVVDASVDAPSPRSLGEAMHEWDFEAMYKQIKKAKDVES